MPFWNDIKGEIRRTARTACCSACSLFALILFAACTADDGLPDEVGKEICFTTQMAVVTRSTLDGSWTDGDTLTICTGGNSRNYTVDSAGILSPGSDGALCWHRSDTIHVTGYYSPLHPLTNRFQIEYDQHLTVNGRLTRDLSDVLYAPSTTVNFGDTCRLNFKHLAAYVRLTVTPDSTVTANNMASAKIRFVNQHIISGKLKSDGTAEQLTTAGDSIIVPYATYSSNVYMKKTVEAMLVPQSGYGTDFITVKTTIENDGVSRDVVFTYTPKKNEKINLESGKLYNISLKLTHTNKLILDKMTISSWSIITDTIESSEYVEQTNSN
jgi:hypothetical protein